MNAAFLREVQQGILNLLLHKLRSFLTMLGVVFGVGSVVAMLAIGEGASHDALERIRKLGSSNIIVQSIKPVDDETGSQRNVRVSVYGLTYADFDRIAETLPDIRRAVPVKVLRKQGQLDDRTMDLRLVGTTPDWFDLVRRPLIAGRTMNQIDVDTHAGVVVLTEHGARKLLATRESIGQPVRLGGSFFEVIGIVQSETSQGGSVQTPDSEIDAYIPLSIARGRFGDLSTIVAAGSRIREQVELHQIIVEAESTDCVKNAAAAIEHMLKRFHDRTDYRMSIPLALLQEAEATKRMFSIVLGSIAGISLLVGGIGIMNIMLASVTERTREIGIRRAIGAKRKQIIRQFLLETIVLSSLGGFIGMLLGLMIPMLITHFAGMPTIVTPLSLLVSLGISMGIGIVFGLYPAARAAALDPIVALRHE
ncbi:MAG TPA: ABC transporter permease [Sedimentisphaerales bacterium]|nr:ABC transporter permease [Sedimentisphaerales bacterium]